MFKVLLLDDHPLFRKGIAQVLVDAGIASSVIESTLAEEAFRSLDNESDIDFIFLDLQLPDMDGQSFLEELALRHIAVPVLILTGNTEPECINRALLAGASAYLDKSTLGDEISEAIKVVDGGGCYVGKALRRLLDNYRAGQEGSGQSSIHLTLRQRQVLQCLNVGLSNQKIAEDLKIAESTVKGHVSTLFSIFNVDNRVQCINAAKRHKLL